MWRRRGCWCCRRTRRRCSGAVRGSHVQAESCKMQFFQRRRQVKVKGRTLERQSLAQVQAAIARAMQYAEEHKIPLTVERLAAELGVSVTTLRGYLREEYVPPARARATVEAVRRAADEATARVVEYAMDRGTSANMHMMYLKQYAGYGERETPTAGEPVIFQGDEEV